MKYTKKIPKTDLELSNILISKGWKRLKEPSNLFLAILFSIPFMIINSVIFGAILFFVYPPLKDFINTATSADTFSISLNIDLKMLLFIVVIFLFMIIHEFIHASFIPSFLKSDKIFWGINGLFGFVYTTEKIKKSRYILISIMPFVLLSIIFPLILSSLGLLNGFIVFLCLLNAMGSSVDSLNIWIILRQVPNGSYIVNNGFETFYKTAK